MTLNSHRPSRVSAGLAALVAAASLTACNLQISNQAEAKTEWTKSYSLAKGGTFEIRNTNGLIDVSPSDNDQISVVAEKIAKAGTDDAAKTAADEIEIRETVSADAIVLDAKMSLTGLFGGSRQVKFHIKAPKGTTLRLSNTNGAIDITDMRGDLRLETTNGAVKAVGIAGPTRAITTNGAVVLDFDSLPEGAVSAETTNGAVSMTIPREAKANISVRVTNGGISIDGLDVTVTEKSRRRLDGTLNGGGADVRVETTNGGVRLRGR